MSDSSTAAPTVISDLQVRGEALLQNGQPGIQSDVLYDAGDGTKAHLFALHEDDTFPEHATSRAALIHVIAGEAVLTVGDDTVEAGPHTWMHLPPDCPHSIQPCTSFLFVLHVHPSG